MQHRSLWRVVLASALLLALIGASLGGPTTASRAAPAGPAASPIEAANPEESQAQPGDAAATVHSRSGMAEGRLDPRLLAAIQAASVDPAAASATTEALATVEAQGSGLDAFVHVAIQSEGPLALRDLADKAASTRWPTGQVITLARIRLGNLLKAAAIPNVVLIEDAAHPLMTDDRQMPEGMPEELAPDSLVDFDALLAADVPYAEAPPLAILEAGASARDGAPAEPEAAAGDPAAPAPAASAPAADGWLDPVYNHRTSGAWSKGWTGTGVRVGVSDTGVDFVAPELVGTWATIDDPQSPYHGWPQALDAVGLYTYVQDEALETSATALGATGHVQILQDYVATREDPSAPKGSACFKRIRRPAATPQQPNPVVAFDADPTCDYQVPWTSQSGSYRFGPHPDPYLFNRYVGERIGLLLVDEGESGVYDTVYVDFDNDRDFTDEKPVTREDPLAYRDLDGNGWADVSGGLLYWISDGDSAVPGAYLWGDLAGDAPEQGRLVTFIGPFGGDHGTLCASNVAAQGVLPVPEGISLRFRDLPGDGAPPYLLKGAAPGAKVVGIYRGGTITSESTYIYAAYGHEQGRSSDDLQLLSNSYPLRNVFEEGWDNASRLVDAMVEINPSVSYVWSTGNGGPGYGSLRDPNPKRSVKVAASTQFGSTGYGSITDTTQVLWGDIIPFSSMGPASDGTIGPHIAADGAYASGSTIVNRFSGQNVADIRRTVVTWGGTSRSTPVTAGHMALIYQAFQAREGRWPSWDEARAILMSGAFQNGYDSFMSGAGVIDGARSAFIAGGLDGLYAQPSVFTPGDYRGEVFESFPALVAPGDTREASITLHNPSPRPIQATVTSEALRRFETLDFEWSSQELTKETAVSSEIPDYLVEIPVEDIPEDAELMVVRAVLPLEEQDLGLDYTICSAVNPSGGCNAIDNRWWLFVYQHTDINGDGLLWHDRDDDGVVDKALLNTTSQIDNIRDINWAMTELDRWEFQRFTQDQRSNNNMAAWVHHPRDRFADGLYIGLHHAGRSPAMPITTLDVRVEFYRYEPWEWVMPPEGPVTVPAGGSVDVPLTVEVPGDASYGYTQGHIFATYVWEEPIETELPGKLERAYLPLALQSFDWAAPAEPADPAPAGMLGSIRALRASPGDPGGRANSAGEPHRLNVPVLLNVGAEFGAEAVALAGPAGQDPALPYANARMRTLNRWGYGQESADWRFFMFDVPDELPEGLQVVLRSAWEDGKALDAEGAEVARTDIDTRLFSPASDRWTDPEHPDNAEEDLSNPALFGPASVAASASSVSTHRGSGIWSFETATGDYEEWVTGPVRPGLNLVMTHNHLMSGRNIDFPYTLHLDRALLKPDRVEASASGCQAVTFQPSFALPSLSSSGAGLSPQERFLAQAIGQDDPNNPLTASWKRSFSVQGGSIIQIRLDGQPGTDLDLFLFRDANGDGTPSQDEQVASSTSPEADEAISYANPADGSYIVTVHGWSVPEGTTSFDLSLLAIQGQNVYAQGLPDGGIAADQEVVFEVCYNLPESPMPGDYRGVFYLGPSAVPRLFTIPIQVTVPAP